MLRQVVHDAVGEGRAGGQMDDLLGAFNVATFKTSEEDDEAFWSRLIPEEQRSTAQAAVQVHMRYIVCLRQLRMQALYLYCTCIVLYCTCIVLL